MESPKRAEIKEAPKPPQKKTEKKIEKSDREEIADSSKKKKAPAEERIEQTAAVGLKSPTKKEEKPRDEKEPNRSLQEAIEDIRKKAALDTIQKKVTQREGEKSRGEGGSTSRSSQGPIVSSSGNVPGSGSGSGAGAGPGGTGTGSGSGTGAGTGTGSGSGSGGSPWGGSGAVDSRLSEYYGRIWAKIKEEWTLPENLPQEKADLETIIVVIIEKDGKIQKSWFEKKSGNSLYDQMAMRAIKKAEPLPPIPKEFSDDTFEIGIRFYPD
jgi:TonB family protein